MTNVNSRGGKCHVGIVTGLTCSQWLAFYFTTRIFLMSLLALYNTTDALKARFSVSRSTWVLRIIRSVPLSTEIEICAPPYEPECLALTGTRVNSKVIKLSSPLARYNLMNVISSGTKQNSAVPCVDALGLYIHRQCL